MSKDISSASKNLGNALCGMHLYWGEIVTDVLLHIVFFVTMKSHTWVDILFLVISFFGFMYPIEFVFDNIWLMRREVRNILKGKLLINRKYYMNYARTDYDDSELMDVTISIPVYKENNQVIFETISSSILALKYYHNKTNKGGNVIVSDDGLAGFLGGYATKRDIDKLMIKYETNPEKLTDVERIAAERIKFYRDNKVGFVVRPVKNRAGLFKKASNLNYTLKLGQALMRGEDEGLLISEEGEFYNGYFEMDVITKEVIMLIDKDSIVKEKVIDQIVPEFIFDRKLAYVQCSTRMENLHSNYFAHATGIGQNICFSMIWPEKALQGFFVPFVGHNAFIRRDALVESGYWNETKVSEDYDKALEFIKFGYHGKFAQIKGCEFGELTSETFTEEVIKKYRYLYGMFEMMFDGTVRNTSFSDFLTMFMNFCGYFNEIAIIPILILCFALNKIDILWLGYVFCIVDFILLPLIRTALYRECDDYKANFVDTVLMAAIFFSSAPFELCAFIRYLGAKFFKIKRSFPSTPAGERLDFKTSLRNLCGLYKKNIGVLIVYVLILNWIVLLLSRISIFVMSKFTYIFMFVQVLVSPLILSPGLFRKGNNENV